MEDIRIPAIVGSIVLGMFVGMAMIAPAGLKFFGPIGDNPDNWNLVGAIIGIAIHVWFHFQHKKSNKRNTTTPTQNG
jgi:hypothetical protein